MGRNWRWTAWDGIALALAAAIAGGMYAFRRIAIAPRATVGQCAAAQPPGFCGPRALVLHWQYLHVFGWAALALGLVAFFTGNRWASMLALAVGIAATTNYNATTGLIGATLGLIAWGGRLTGRCGQA